MRTSPSAVRAYHEERRLCSSRLDGSKADRLVYAGAGRSSGGGRLMVRELRSEEGRWESQGGK